ncbi:spindle pole body component spc42 [Maudiozyma exigua]|uniref:Spindle pole body component SPC42 n=1 Tax=Maudiozyma exigua TaxID=34358 RepID=A0A9P6WCB5_MAUEX|nr:spindle pole body component spc42 [Kazachstania exigua]
MNISPTPRRYTTRTGNPRIDPLGMEDKYYFTDPLRKPNLRNGRYNNNNDVLLPPEYKLSAQTFNELIEQNKRLTNMLEGKQREINELKAENSEFRSKLWKYTEMADRYKNEIDRRDNDDRQRVKSQNMSQPTDYIQINKKRGENNTTTPYRNTTRKENRSNRKNARDDTDSEYDDDSEDSRYETAKSSRRSKSNSQQAEKLETLMKNVEHINRILSDSLEEAPAPKVRSSSIIHPTDTDILMTESSELQSLEDQIRVLQNKLNIKQQNEKRKVSLQQRLRELQETLNSTSLSKENSTSNTVKQNFDHTLYESDTDDSIPIKQKNRIRRVDKSTIFGTPKSEV